MICKRTQNTIDTLLRLKDSYNNDSNKIASIMSKSHDNRTKEENQILSLHLIKHLMDKYKDSK